MEEARKQVRLTMRAEIAYVVLPSGTAQETHTHDVSATGVRLALDHALPPGTQLQIAMALPGVEEPVNAVAEIIWSHEQQLTGKTGQQRSAQAGARFAEIAPKDQEAISQVIAQHLR